MTKGKPWTRDQEKKLQEFVKAKVSPEAIARELGISVGSVLQKMRRLGLEVVVHCDCKILLLPAICVSRELYSES